MKHMAFIGDVTALQVLDLPHAPSRAVFAGRLGFASQAPGLKYSREVTLVQCAFDAGIGSQLQAFLLADAQHLQSFLALCNSAHVHGMYACMLADAALLTATNLPRYHMKSILLMLQEGCSLRPDILSMI